MEEAKQAAPQLVAQGDDEVAKAQAQTAEGDDTAASLHAEAAEALYLRARVQARLARADLDRTDAERSLAEATSQRDAYAKTRAELSRTTDDLDVKLRVARERAFPAASGPASKEREAARRAAARSLAEEARLLCTAARIVGATGDDITQAESELDGLVKDLEGNPEPSRSGATPPTPPSSPPSASLPAVRTSTATATAKSSPPPALLDRAAKARVHCLSTLEHARKEDAMTGTKNDALLAALSSAGYRPTRAEEGVTVTLADAFDGAALSQSGKKKLAELGRVAREEKVGVELVLHDAQDPSARDAANDKARADLAADALAGGGADRGSMKVELAGAKLPLFDPQDLARRAKNARLDVIFVR
jgi:hypothetical protein